MFINFTNHSSVLWDDKQKEDASQYGMIYDIPFPQISPQMSSDEIKEMAEYWVKIIKDKHPKAILVQGEMTLTYHIVRLLKKDHFKVLCACSVRQAQERKDEKGRIYKESIFHFIKFREY